jgi:predicted AAA+ superfamily ATPase
MDVPRTISAHLAPSFPPVTILEGPRTCGKTHVARRLSETGVWQGFESLADPATVEIARHDLDGWLRSLPATTIIDEAQLIAQLPLIIKQIVDEPGSTRRFLLTGSARLGRTSLGGSDPLTGRARRWTLNPLTFAEMNGHGSRLNTLIAELFSGEIMQVDRQTSVEMDMQVNVGGFPLIALAPVTVRERDQWVRDTTLGLLTDQVLPDDRFDTGMALRVLDGVLRDPAGVLNIDALGRRLDLNPRTIDRYLDVLERRFMVRFLPNFATNPTRQTRARSKVHAIDTAFAAESLRRANPSATTSPDMKGHLFETWVVSQIVPALQYADTPIHAYYWRDAKTQHEVDLVLADTENRLVGIEVKSSTRVSLDDARGLVGLRAAKGLTKGYVVYGGTAIVRLTEDCWAIPRAALG